MADVTAETTTPENEILFQEHYQAHLPEYLALKPEELAPINIDVTSALTTALGARAEILQLAPRIAEELPKFNLAQLMVLDEYAMALSYAQTLFLMASQPADALQAVVAEGTELRETLLSDANALVRRGVLSGAALKDLQGPVGFKNLAVDLQLLAAFFLENFSKIEGKSGTKREELVNANRIAATILRAVGLREQGSAAVTATADMRVRAFTLFSRVYDQARRAVTYLRWVEDDADSIAPSLYAGRGGRKKPRTDAAPAVAPAPTPTAPAATPGSDAPAQPVTAAPGTPGAQPFLP